MVGIVPSVQIGIVDCLERYLVYRLGWWLDCNGTRRANWVCGYFLLESNKDRFLGVDPPSAGKHVPPRVRYGTACLLIRELGVCFLFKSNGKGYGYTWDPQNARGARDGETLAKCETDLKQPL
jgi:hypothetical protein